MQDNCSRSVKGTLRGLHFQEPKAQGKLVQVLARRGVRRGRRHPPGLAHLRQVVRRRAVSEENQRQLWVPPGFAHGFCVLSESADFLYKCTDVYAPGARARRSLWNDPDIGIDWPVKDPLLSKKDAAAPALRDAARLFG